MTILHVLFDPTKNDFHRGVDGKPITTTLTSPTRGDAAGAVAAHHAALPAELQAKTPAAAPPGTHWMQLEGVAYDVGQGSFEGPNNYLGEPVIEMYGPRAIQKFPILRRK
jgi:hypothetical protein